MVTQMMEMDETPLVLLKISGYALEDQQLLKALVLIFEEMDLSAFQSLDTETTVILKMVMAEILLVLLKQTGNEHLVIIPLRVYEQIYEEMGLSWSQILTIEMMVILKTLMVVTLHVKLKPAGIVPLIIQLLRVLDQLSVVMVKL